MPWDIFSPMNTKGVHLRLQQQVYIEVVGIQRGKEIVSGKRRKC